MKKIALYILCGVMALFTSCDPSLLDLQNENTLSTGIYWKTESDIEAGVIAVYGMFYRQGTWTRNIYTQMIGMADEGVSYAGWTELNEYTKFIFTDYNFSEVNTKIWREHYTAIFRANQVLDNIVNVPMLLGVPGAKLSDIKTVYSHAQALAQSSDFLSAHKEWKQIAVLNTAVAAKKVMEEQDPSQAAVASRTAGELYGMEVLAEEINNVKGNTTRFLILGKEPVYAKKAGKISVAFEIPHKSGSLYNILGNFIFNNVNMMMIESRPIPEKSFEYRFFVDFEGNLSDAGVRNALTGIAAEASVMRILGNY